MRDEGANWMWFLAGAALGTAVGLLYAPANGAETRRYLARKAQEGRKTIAGSGREFLERGRELYEKSMQLADDAADLYDEGRRLMEEA